MRARSAILAFFVSIFPLTPAFSALDYIDADGVTEIGGPGRGRMIPRTLPTGKLDASLLPTGSAYTPSPVSSMLYVASAVTDTGNGSAVSPFKTLQEAVSAAQSGSVIICAPGTYAGTISLQAGEVITLSGFGASTVFSRLTVIENGNSSATELRICNSCADDVRISGGKAGLRLTNSKVGRITNDTSSLQVVREDMGSRVEVAGSGMTDVYAGYNTVSNAFVLLGDTADSSLSMRNGRPTVGNSVVAFQSDVASASAEVYHSIEALEQEDTRLHTRISAEETARASATSTVYKVLGAATNSLAGAIRNIREDWQRGDADILQLINEVNSVITNLADKEERDYANTTGEVERVKIAYRSADETTLTSAKTFAQQAVSALEGTLPSTIDTRADARILEKQDGIISTAVNDAKSYTDERETAVREAVSAVSSDVANLESTVSGHTGSIGTLTSRCATLNTDIGAVASDLEAAVTTINGKITPLETSVSGHQTRITAAEGDIISCKAAINKIAAEIRRIHGGSFDPWN